MGTQAVSDHSGEEPHENRAYRGVGRISVSGHTGMRLCASFVLQ